MKFVTPSTHLIAYTVVDQFAEAEMLAALGAPENWTTDAPDDAARLTEVMGRLCYKSFGTDMNPNITKVREGNKGYVGNILKVKHGSVIEHASATIVFVDVSPVVTHELVRHRVGTAFSQVSMRFVRLTEIGAYFPQAFSPEFLEQMFKHLAEFDTDTGSRIDGDEEMPSAFDMAVGEASLIRAEFQSMIEMLEQWQVSVAQRLRLDEIDPDNNQAFHFKKRITSSMRRLAPYGLSTSIGVTANHRAWRFMIAQRTHRSAEEEIRLVFGQVAEKLASAFPNLYQDMRMEHVDGFAEYTFDNHKV